MKDAINLSSYLISTITSIVTVIIALLLFDRFGVSKKTLDKKVETVFSLLEAINSKIFFAEYESDSGTYYAAIPISDNLCHFKKKKTMLQKDILFNYEDINNSIAEINQFASNIWLPVEIKEKIEKIKISFLSASSVKDNFAPKNKYVRISLHLYPEARKGKKVMWYMANEGTTFIEFLSNLEELVSEIKSWLNKHSNHDLKLNI